MKSIYGNHSPCPSYMFRTMSRANFTGSRGSVLIGARRNPSDFFSGPSDFTEPSLPTHHIIGPQRQAAADLPRMNGSNDLNGILTQDGPAGLFDVEIGMGGLIQRLRLADKRSCAVSLMTQSGVRCAIVRTAVQQTTV
jgi:hypothetical protein